MARRPPLLPKEAGSSTTTRSAFHFSIASCVAAARRLFALTRVWGGGFPSARARPNWPRDMGPAAKAFPEIRFIVYHSGYERNPDGQEGPLDEHNPGGVDRLIMSARAAGIGHDGNIYCELGSTWFMMLRRPLEAAHIMGKLLNQFGPRRIL